MRWPHTGPAPGVALILGLAAPALAATAIVTDPWTSTTASTCAGCPSTTVPSGCGWSCDTSTCCRSPTTGPAAHARHRPYRPRLGAAPPGGRAPRLDRLPTCLDPGASPARTWDAPVDCTSPPTGLPRRPVQHALRPGQLRRAAGRATPFSPSGPKKIFGSFHSSGTLGDNGRCQVGRPATGPILLAQNRPLRPLGSRGPSAHSRHDGVVAGRA